MTRTVSAAGMDWGVLAAAGVLTIVPGAAMVIHFDRNYIAKGFALGARAREIDMNLSWMAWTLPTALLFLTILVLLIGMSVWEYFAPGGIAAGRRAAFRNDAR